MPVMFPISAAALPSVPTRKALLVLDLQRDFVDADGALPVTEPDGFVSRTLELVKAFRSSGAGDVIWVCTEFERNRPISPEDDRILVSDLPIRRAPSGARRPPMRTTDKSLEKDSEAFLTVSPGSNEKPCVRKGSPGAELAPEVKDAVVAGRDIVFTKTDYSAFAPGQQQLVQMLRGRFVTKMYLCGALTNVSIYATALDAGMHGYEMTLVEDCCGFRREIRHINAIKQLADITGCATTNSPDIIRILQPPKKETTGPSTPKEGGKKDGIDQEEASTGLSPVLSHMTLVPSSPSPTTSSVSPPEIPSTSPPTLPQTSSHIIQPTTPPGNTSKSDDDNKSGASLASIPAPLEPHTNDTVIEPDSAEEDSDSLGLSNRFKALLASAASKRGARTRLSAAAPNTSTTTDRPRTMAKPRVRQASNSPETKPLEKQTSQSASPDSDTKTKTLSPRTTPIHPTSNQPSIKAESSTSDQEDQDPSEPDAKTESAEPKPTTMAEPILSVVSEPLCAGDTTIITNVLPPALAADAFERLLNEVSWATMSHLGGEVPRRIAVQGAVDADGSMPVYRHPSDESPPLLPFTPTVLAIKAATEKHLGHPLNHVLIQHYRSGADYISEHSDKTLDVCPSSFIANVSLGAERTMVFRTKRPRKDAPTPAPPRGIQRAPLPHNSLCRMGLETNMRWTHAIRQDKRADREKAPAELGARISLTFRRIGTFLDASQSLIWGQGAVSKTRAGARPVVSGQTPDAVRLLQAFGAENNAAEFDWQTWYGAGFDVLHMGTPKRFCAAAGDAVGSAGVGIALAEMGVGCAKGSVEGGRVRFEDNDPGRTTVEGAGTVLRYLDAVYGAGRRYDQMLAAEVARRFGLLQGALDLAGVWKTAVERADGDKAALGKVVRKDVLEWEGHAKKSAESSSRKGDGEEEDAAFYIAGGTLASPADFALWPVLNDMVRECGEAVLDGEKEGDGYLRKYYRAFGERGSVKKVLGLGPKEKGSQEAKTE
ncbi:alpha-ketoglutarate-dependent dioxygenase alkB 2 [Podospora conica]|nr:alpha-ketoglutarate-dependent dioxygenase alkB 2 [Schizothecium conicum]